MRKKQIAILITTAVFIGILTFLLSKTNREKYISFCYGKNFPTLNQEGKHIFPYSANKERREQLENGYIKVQEGLNVDDVIKKMGNPDNYAFPLSSIFFCSNTNFSYIYYLNLEAEENLSKPLMSGHADLKKYEKYYIIVFDADWKVNHIQEVSY